MSAPYVDLAVIKRQAPGGAYERGLGYHRSGAVFSLEWDAVRSTLTGRVRGSGAKVYTTTIRIDPDRAAGPIAAANCTCPMVSDCKHTVAVLLASNERRNPVPPPGTVVLSSSVPKRAVEASWRDLFAVDPVKSRAIPLALGVELRHRTARGRASWSPQRTETATPRMLDASLERIHVGLRPIMQSTTTQKWIKGDVSWDVLRRADPRFATAERQWFVDLHTMARDGATFVTPLDSHDWVTVDNAESASFWQHLVSAAAHGIPIVSLSKTLNVSIADTAEAAVVAEQMSTGNVRIDAVFTVGEELISTDHIRVIGEHGLYVVTRAAGGTHLTLASTPVAPVVRSLMSGPIFVPAAERDEFLRKLPRLARTVEVKTTGGLELLPPVRPVLNLTVTYRAGDTVAIAAKWAYGEIVYNFDDPNFSDDRDAEAEAEILARVEHVWTAATALPLRAMTTVHGIVAAEVSAEVLPQLSSLDDVEVSVVGRRRDYRELTGAPEITVTTVESTDNDWFDLGILVRIDGRTIPFTPLFSALAQGKKKLLLSDGGYFSLAHPSLDRLRDLIEEASELTEWEPENLKISRHQTDLWEEFEDLADEAVPAVSWRATVEGLRDVERVEPVAAPAGLNATLRPYQQAGFEWLAFLWQHRLGGILADDMGLGKTLQLLALMAHTRETGEKRPFLVVAPTSVLATWQSEAARFTPGLRVTIVDATSAKRGATVADAAASADVVVTSYTLVRLDDTEFAEVEWAALVLDEAQFVKNPSTKLHRAVRDLKADVTYAVTGTPMENTLTDLWALLSLSAPGLFASQRRFRQDYVGPIEKGKVPENQEGGPYRAARLERLRRRIRPLMLRRTKELVAADLPPKQEQVLSIELAPAHRALYDTVLQRERQKVLGLLQDLDKNRFIVFRSLTLLRLMSLAPELVDPAHAHIPSGKIDALIDQLVEVAAEGHRALVFSQFTSFLALLSKRLDAEGIRYAYLDGSTRRRPEVIEGFRAGDDPVFLISLKAGGFGLTLTEADYVFLLDPWWNPAAESQAIDRTHRIGQTRPVNVYRMIAAGTIEERVMSLQQRKARLFDAVVDDDDLFSNALNADDIRGLFEG